MTHSRVSKPLPPLSPADVKRFAGYVDKKGPTACWLWKGPRSVGYKGGVSHVYGVFGVGGKLVKAQRVAFFLKHKEDPAGLLVCHSCDNTLCCNTRHLFKGAYADNNRDCRRKNRDAYGSKHGRVKLTPKQVLRIRARRKAGATYQSLADGYGMALTSIYDLCRGKNWRRIQ